MTLNNFKPKTKRTKIIIKQIGMSSIYKILTILITFFLVPLSITYLGSEKYGLWLTIFSFIGWFSFFDFGIGNGLRNKLTVALSSNDTKLAQSYISTTYFTMLIISFFLILLSIIPLYFISWNSVFNYEEQSLTQLIAVVFIIFSVNLVLKIITIVYYSDHKSETIGLINLFGQIIIFISIYIALKVNTNSLLFYGFIVVFSQTFVFILITLIAFFGKYSEIRPRIKSFEKKHLNDILSIGGKFFLLQINAVLIYSTDNFIINYFLGAEQVTIFNIAFKYFMIITMAMTIIITPYWSAFTNAIAKNDDIWIKNSIINLFKISILANLMIIIMIFISDTVYLLWVGDQIKIPFILTILIGINTIIIVFKQPISMYINGIGKLKIQLYISSIGALINIPLSILLAVYFNLGVAGVVLGTITIGIIELIIYPIQVKKLISKTAKGIWNE